ncbi:MAG: DivIVA domain-containing protein, partial [Acidimicrobiales bacterium]
MSVDNPRDEADDALSADAVGQRTFPVGFRGFDQSDVREYLGRVSAEMRALKERADVLERKLAEATEKAAHPELDEDLVFGAVGEETASLLRSARSAAAEVRTRASEEVARLVAEATERGQALIADAEAQLGRATTEAENVGASIRDEAQRDAEARLAAASQEADRVVSIAQQSAEVVRAKAEQDARLTVEGAQAVREKTLADLARRRRVAMVQIEQLRVGRERLLEAYGVVRRTLQEVHEELRRADDEARSAAFETGRRLREDALPDDSGEIPVVDIVGEAGYPGAEQGGEPAVVVVEVTAEVPLEVAEEVVAEVIAEALDEVLEEAAEEALEEAIEEAAEEALEEAVEETLEEALEAVVEEALEEGAEEAVEEAAGGADEEAAEAPEPMLQDPEPLPQDPEPLPQAPPGQEASVEDLFARIRAGRDEATAQARAALHLDEPEVEVDEGGEGPIADAADDNDDDLSLHVPRLADDEELLQRRDAALG